MGRKKHCTPEQRDLIRKLVSSGKSYREVKNIVGCSFNMVHNAITHKEHPETRGRRPALSIEELNEIISLSKQHPLMPAIEIKRQLNLKTSDRTIRRYLRLYGLEAPSTLEKSDLFALSEDSIIEQSDSFAPSQEEWTKEQTLYLISYYENLIFLYDTTHPDFQNADKTKEAYDYLVENLKGVKPDVTTDEIQNKIKMLTKQIEAEEKRRNAHIASGKPTLYKPRLWCYEYLHFLVKSFEKENDIAVVESQYDSSAVHQEEKPETNNSQVNQQLVKNYEMTNKKEKFSQYLASQFEKIQNDSVFEELKLQIMNIVQRAIKYDETKCQNNLLIEGHYPHDSIAIESVGTNFEANILNFNGNVAKVESEPTEYSFEEISTFKREGDANEIQNGFIEHINAEPDVYDMSTEIKVEPPSTLETIKLDPFHIITQRIKMETSETDFGS